MRDLQSNFLLTILIGEFYLNFAPSYFFWCSGGRRVHLWLSCHRVLDYERNS